MAEPIIIDVDWEGKPLDGSPAPEWDATDLRDQIATAIERASFGHSLVPLSCDLTGDKIACAILRAWARQPWEPVHRAALLDRMEELGGCPMGKAIVQRLDQQVLRDLSRHKRTRTTYHRFLKLWKAVLIDHFGDFESKYSTP
jgi:hypothetical protein